ncbi:MAG: hypothetical protein ABJQ34_14790 [Paracoccaceae bacterium]
MTSNTQKLLLLSICATITFLLISGSEAGPVAKPHLLAVMTGGLLILVSQVTSGLLASGQVPPRIPFKTIAPLAGVTGVVLMLFGVVQILLAFPYGSLFGA